MSFKKIKDDFIEFFNGILGVVIMLAAWVLFLAIIVNIPEWGWSLIMLGVFMLYWLND